MGDDVRYLYDLTAREWLAFFSFFLTSGENPCITTIFNGQQNVMEIVSAWTLYSS